jgi:uncharacterized protein
MKLPVMPKNIERIETDTSFTFNCHPDVPCFTNCCRQLDLALTPYDVLRLKNSLEMDSELFLDRYVIVEKDEHDVFPRYYLTMVDDGNASCVFVTEKGCSHYDDRPGACRTYPMGRAAMRVEEDKIQEFFVLLKEDHCQGFQESAEQTPISYCEDQGLSKYNRYNDAVAGILQHEKIRQGMAPTEQQLADFHLSLYNLDQFRRLIQKDTLPDTNLTQADKEKLANDEDLFTFAISWLSNRLFGDDTGQNK